MPMGNVKVDKNDISKIAELKKCYENKKNYKFKCNLHNF